MKGDIIMPSPELKIRQFQHEIDTWKRNLEFLLQENVNLKNRLAEVLQTVQDDDILEAAETFQSEFLREDEAIQILRGDIAKQDHLLTREIYENGYIIKDVVRQQKKLSEGVKNVVSGFNKLKFDFNSYLGEVL
ncbi:MAG: hypothetical protein B6D37_05260 [Sphingobacteriales bacterium UTBCD1]|jgi:regulator of replication initiation timing|nr:MAG: hypothetical protein B6D37_05260 [Sphingobacteriales bacterium UTBCD1]